MEAAAAVMSVRPEPTVPPERRISAESLVEVVREVTAELHPRGLGGHEVALDSSLERDLGLDSLGRVEVLLRLERVFGLSLSEQVLATAESPRDLLRAAQAAGVRVTTPGPEQGRIELERASGVPERAATLSEVLDWHAERHPERVHIHLYEEGGQTREITYAELRAGAGAVARGLAEHGLLPGETVGLMHPTGFDYFLALYGTLLAGGVPVPLYPPARPGQLEDHLRRQTGILANARSRFLVTVDQAKPLLRLVAPHAPELRSLVTVGDLSAAGPSLPPVPRAAGDVVLLQYTSGSTGQPKGVVVTHANLLANLRAGGAAIQADSSDVFVSWLPLYHDMGLIGACFASLYFAIPLVLMSPLAFLTRPERWLQAIHRHRGTLTASPNFGYELCLRRVRDEHLEGLDLSSLRVAFNGAEPVSPETIAAFPRRFAAWGFRPEAMYPVYGLAESTVALAFPPLGRAPLVDAVRRDELASAGRAVPADAGDASALHFVSCGGPIPGHEIRIVDAAGSELGERREGRLQFRGPSATSGYFRNPEATRRLFHGDWLDSGDRAYVAAGEVYLTGRAKDLVIRAGRNIYPHELEEAVGDLPGVRKGCVAVFGSPDPVSGTERLVVVAESRAGETAEREEIARRITALSVDLVGAPPEDVVVAPPHTVLKTSSGKIRRAACRELYESGRIGAAERAPWVQLVRVAASTLWPSVRRVLQAGLELAYGWLAWLVAGAATALLWAGSACLPGVERRWRFVARVLRLVARLTATPLRVDGLDNLPRDQPFVLAANHSSYLDGMVLTALLPLPLAWVVKRELRESWTTSLPLRRLGVLFVERFDAEQGAEDARRLTAELRRGRSLGFFPEGTFVRSPGLLPFRMGAFVAAAQAGVPLVPVVVRGTRSKLRAGQWRPRRGGVAVRVLPPIAADGDGWKDAVALRERARAEILRLVGEPDAAR